MTSNNTRTAIAANDDQAHTMADAERTATLEAIARQAAPKIEVIAQTIRRELMPMVHRFAQLEAAKRARRIERVEVRDLVRVEGSKSPDVAAALADSNERAEQFARDALEVLTGTAIDVLLASAGLERHVWWSTVATLEHTHLDVVDDAATMGARHDALADEHADQLPALFGVPGAQDAALTAALDNVACDRPRGEAIAEVLDTLVELTERVRTTTGALPAVANDHDTMRAYAAGAVDLAHALLT